MMNRSRWSILALLAVGLAVVIFEPHQWLKDQWSTEEVEATATEPETAEVSIQTLAIDLSADGSLVFAGNAGAYAAEGGVVTAVVAEDAVAPPGTVLWRIGLEPTVLLTGGLPSYRDLTSGDTGSDVWQLEANLVALGFDPNATVTIDDTYTNYTASMVERWQESIGAEVTGEVAPGAVVYASADRRVGLVDVTVGDSVTDGQRILELTAQQREVVFTVAAADRDTITVGDSVAVRLPDRAELSATVTAVVVDEAGGASVTATLEEATEQQADNLPATISWSVTLAENVVAVPESALLRVDHGGYVAELLDGPQIPVVPGAAANGWVEVTGAVEPGDIVIAP